MGSLRRLLGFAPCVVFGLVIALIVGYQAAWRDRSGPLNLGYFTSSVGLGVDVGQVMTYGDVIVRNEGSRPLVVDQVELLTDDSGATVGEVRVLDTEAVPAGTMVGEAMGFNPPSVAMTVPGAVMEPYSEEHAKHYQFIFSVRVKESGGTLFHGIRVRYPINDRPYVKTANYQLRLCTPVGVTCIPPPAKDL